MAKTLTDVVADPTLPRLVVLGTTGSGKSVFLEQAGAWAAAQGHRVISLDAYGNSARLVSSRGGTAYALSADRCLNLLDIVYDERSEGGWLQRQVEHGVGVVSALLSEHARNEMGYAELRPRAFSPGERGALEGALSQLYATHSSTTPLDAMPSLSDLLDTLEQGKDPECFTIALALREVLFYTDDPATVAQTSVGRRFDGVTTVPWSFTSALTAIDTSNALEPWRALIDTHVLGAVLRFLGGLGRLERGRERHRTTALLLDPVDELLATAAGGQLLTELARRAKQLNLQLIAVAQEPHCLLETVPGRSLWENSAKVLFRLRDVDARWMADSLPALQPDHLRTITMARNGHGLLVRDDGVTPLDTEIQEREQENRERAVVSKKRARQ